MKITVIDADNIRFFENAIGSRYVERKENDLFVGVVDEDGEAVGAGVFSGTPEGLFVEQIVVTGHKRRKGVGSFLLEEVSRLASEAGIPSLTAVFYGGDRDQGADILRHFFSKNGFSVESPSAARTVYDMREVLSAPAFSEGRLRRPYRIKTAAELTEEEREKVRAIEDPMIDPEEVVSLKNRYGGILFNKDEVCALLYAEPFCGGVRIGSLYGNGDGISLFPYLFEHAREIVRREGIAMDELYVDTAGEKTARFEEMYLTKLGIRPKDRYSGCGAIKTLATEPDVA